MFICDISTNVCRWKDFRIIFQSCQINMTIDIYDNVTSDNMILSKCKKTCRKQFRKASLFIDSHHCCYNSFLVLYIYLESLSKGSFLTTWHVAKRYCINITLYYITICKCDEFIVNNYFAPLRDISDGPSTWTLSSQFHIDTMLKV